MKRLTVLFILSFLLFQTSKAQTWSTYGVGFSPNVVYDLIKYNNELYASGGIVNSGSTTINCIARWDGINWNPLANGTNFGGPECMIIYNNDLIAGGSFTSITGVPNAKGVARWDGINWYALGGGVGLPGGNVKAMAVFNGSLYVGGSFTQVDGMPIRNIARWDGSSWFPVCMLSTGLSQLWSMTVFNNELYIGGYFDRINGDTIYNIAKFDGTTWSDVSGGLNSDVAVLFSDTINNRLYAGGNFNSAGLGTISCPSNIAYWDGSNWYPVGINGPALYPRAISIYHNELYAGFVFPKVKANGDTLQFITRWDGNDWQNLGNGVNSSVQAIYVFNNELAVGGGFSIAGDTVANRIASWNYIPNKIHEIKNDAQEEIQIIPNPFTDVIKIADLKIGEHANIIIYDLMGEKVFEKEFFLKSNKTEVELNLSFLQQGVYFLNVKGNGESWTKKVVKM